MADPYAAIAHDPYASMAQSSVVSSSSAAPAKTVAPGGNPEMDRARHQQSAPQPSNPFGRVSAPEMKAPSGDMVLENMKKPGQAYQQLLAHPRDPGAALNVLVNSAPDAQVDANRSRVMNALGSYVGKPNLGQNPSGLGKAATDMWFDPTTLLGGSGLIEKGANALGRTAYIGAAKGMAQANPISKMAAGVHDFVTPGGSELGALKRGLAASEGRTGLDKYAQVRSIEKAAKNSGTDVREALTKELGVPTPAKPIYRPVQETKIVPQTKPHYRLVQKSVTDKPTFEEVPGTKVVENTNKGPGEPQWIEQPTTTTVKTPGETQTISKPVRARRDPQYATQTKLVKTGETTPAPPDWRNDVMNAYKPRYSPPPTSRAGQIAQGASKNAKTLTRGATDLMFAAPQLPGMEGHGSNVLQTALLSDPVTTIGSLARFAGSGEAIPFSKLRDAAQKLPGVRDLKAAQDASVARANESGANTVHPEDFGSGGWLSKIPGIGMAARESNRGLHSWDAAVKGSLNDTYARGFEAQGHTPKMAAAKAADRVAQDVVDYSDVSDATRTAKHALPFATYASKKPGMIARAAIRHPERVLAATRDNPNFEQGNDQPIEGFDKGRPLTSMFNALNNKSPQSKGAAPFPGAQYARASAGAPIADALGIVNPYFTYGPPGKHADGDAAMGWLKLLLSQTVGGAPFVGSNPIPGHAKDTLLNALGMNYFGDQ